MEHQAGVHEPTLRMMEGPKRRPIFGMRHVSTKTVGGPWETTSSGHSRLAEQVI